MKSKYSKNTKFVFQAASLIGAAFSVIPIIYVFIRSLGASEVEFIIEPRIIKALANTFFLTFGVVFCSVILGSIAAFVFESTNSALKKYFYPIFIMPMAIPSYIGAFSYIIFLGPKGLFYEFLSNFLQVTSIPEIYGFWGALLILTIFTYPYVFISVSNALRNFDKKILESAQILGISNIKICTKIILPYLKGPILSASLITALYTISDFGAVSILRFNTLTRVIFVEFTSSISRENAAILSAVLIVLSGSVYYLLVFLFKNTKGSEYFKINFSIENRILFSIPKIFSLIFSIIIASFSFLIPIFSLIWMVVRSQNIELDDINIDSIINTILVTITVGIIIVIFSFIVSFYKERFGGLISKILNSLSNLNYSLPSLIVALSIVFFFSQGIPILYQTLVPLVVALIIKYIPQINLNFTSVLKNQTLRYEEVARVLGAGDGKILNKVVLPQLRGTISSSLAISFLNIIKELPIIILLSPIGFVTITQVIWTANDNANFSRAALNTLILLIVSIIILFSMYLIGSNRNVRN